MLEPGDAQASDSSGDVEGYADRGLVVVLAVIIRIYFIEAFEMQAAEEILFRLYLHTDVARQADIHAADSNLDANFGVLPPFACKVQAGAPHAALEFELSEVEISKPDCFKPAHAVLQLNGVAKDYVRLVR